MGGPGSGTSKSVIVHDDLELERELYSRSFRDYIPTAFEVLESGDPYAEGVREGRYKARYAHGFHIDAIADHLQAVADAQIRFLLINIPPGTAKSVITSALWPTWMWARQRRAKAFDGSPVTEYWQTSNRFLFSSYSEAFTRRDTRRAKALMQSNWYRTRFPYVQLKDSPDTMLEHHNTSGGERHGASTNSGVTGKHVHGIVEDDPIKAQDAQSEHARNEAWFYHTEVLSSRLLPEAGWRVVIMQRLHEDDISGRILAHAEGSSGEYVHLNLPMELELKRRCFTFLKPALDAVIPPNDRSNTAIASGAANSTSAAIEGSQTAPKLPLNDPEARVPFFVDPRTEEGALLWPERMNAKFVAEKKSPQTGLGELGYAGQYQQRPAPAGGALVKREWLRYYRRAELPKRLDGWEQSWDLIFDGDGAGSFVVGQVWARAGANHYLVHQYRERVDFVKTIAAFRTVTLAYKSAMRKKVEKKANGAALIAVLKNKVPGIVAWPPKGKAMQSKSARMEAVSPLFEAGNVWVPDPLEQPWVLSWVEEVVGMTALGPTTANDDQADAATQYLSDKGVVIDDFKLDLSIGAQANPWSGFGGVAPKLFTPTDAM